MQTLRLEEAADLLKCSSDTVLELIHSDSLPAAKIGRSWVLVDVDVIEYIRTKYTLNKEVKKCHSTKGAKRGGSMSLSTDKELESLLATQTREKRKKSTTQLSIVPNN